jgi:tRNA nucleotidyltransferase (CCA-adding enzyme)
MSGVMKIQLQRLEPKLRQVVHEVGREAGREGLAAYVVGGFVRDLLLSKKTLDCDIVIEGDAIALTKRLARRKRLGYVAYPQFGTASLHWDQELSVDLATARSENYSSPGALPQVRPGSLRDDLKRRDFTINALAMNVNQECFGEIVDEFGGLPDLHQGLIRILHPQSFWDDPTRILRAVRFEQRFHFHLERQTRKLMSAAIKAQVWSNVKEPRYFAEFRKILAEETPSRVIYRLHQLGALNFLGNKFQVPIRDLRQVERNVVRLKKDPFYRQQDFSMVFLLTLFSKLNLQEQEALGRRFHLTRSEREALLKISECQKVKRQLRRKQLPPSRIYQILHQFNFIIIFFMIVQASDKILRDRLDAFLQNYRNCKLTITGHDIKAFAGTSGQEIGFMMNQILYQKLDGKIMTRAQELRFARELAHSRKG